MDKIEKLRKEIEEKKKTLEKLESEKYEALVYRGFKLRLSGQSNNTCAWRAHATKNNKRYTIYIGKIPDVYQEKIDCYIKEKGLEEEFKK